MILKRKTYGDAGTSLSWDVCSLLDDGSGNLVVNQLYCIAKPEIPFLVFVLVFFAAMGRLPRLDECFGSEAVSQRGKGD